MTDLASTDVTVTVNERTIVGKKRRNRVTIAFGDGALTYPSGGVPMPAFGSFGMIRNLDFLTVFDEDDASGIVWKYDRTNNKLRGYITGVNVDAAGAVTLDDFPIKTGELATGSLSVSLNNDAGSGVKYLGKLQELAAASSAPAAQTLQAEAVGW